MGAIDKFCRLLILVVLVAGCSKEIEKGPIDGIPDAVGDFALASCLAEQSNDWLQEQAWAWSNAIVSKGFSRADTRNALGELAAVVRERVAIVPMIYGKTLPVEGPESNPLVVRYCGELMDDGRIREAIDVATQAIRDLR